MAYSEIVWAYRDAITIQKQQQVADNTVFTSEHRKIGAELDITGSSTVTVQGGKMEIAGKWLERTVNLTALTAENNADWEEGTSQEGVSATSWYVVAFNDSGASFNVKFRGSGPAYSDTNSATANGIKLYDKTGTTWYRYIGFISNNTATEIRKTIQTNNKITYSVPIELTSATNVAWTDLDLSLYVPTFAQWAVFGISVRGGAGTWGGVGLRPDGAVWNSGFAQQLGIQADGNPSVGGQLSVLLGDTQKIQYITSGITTALSINIESYEIADKS